MILRIEMFAQGILKEVYRFEYKISTRHSDILSLILTKKRKELILILSNSLKGELKSFHFISFRVYAKLFS